MVAAADPPSLSRSVRILLAAFPGAGTDATTRDVYELALRDVDVADLEEIVKVLISTRHRLPTIADVRVSVVERRLQLPSPLEAWELVYRAAGTPLRYIDCADCDGRCYLDADSEKLCPGCGGTGDREVSRTPLLASLPRPVVRALEAVGGVYAISESEAPAVLRAQFLKAYEAARRDTIDATNLLSAGLTPRGALTEGTPDHASQ